jgi:hypothetical protein
MRSATIDQRAGKADNWGAHPLKHGDGPASKAWLYAECVGAN